MEAAFANIIGADMNAVGYKFEFNDLQEALKHILQGETRDILNQELFELKGSYSDVGLSFKALSKLSQIDRLMRIYNSILIKNLMVRIIHSKNYKIYIKCLTKHI